MSSPKIISFGELMLRLATPGFQRFVQTSSLEATFGGGEANVAVSLAHFGLDARFVTVLPKHEIGDAALNALRRYGVDTQHIVRSGDRIGIYFLESGASQRPSKVIYDRGGAAIAGVKPGMIPWKDVLNGAAWFHVTGITPALSALAADTTIEAVQAARAAGATVSCDLNFRKKLWSREKAGDVMSKVCAHVDVLIANEEDAEMVFGIKAEGSDVHAGKVEADKYRSVADQLMKRFSSLKLVAITLRESLSASDNNWSAVAWDGKQFTESRKYSIRIVDRVGGGDSFGAGLIYGLTKEMPTQSALDFAVAASCLKHTIPGDFNHVSVAEVEELLKGGGSGRVQR
ncbi:MAG: sugar kinase [Bacteroidetes bacterium]|jgi:2-dehydro-3-deoxygluconokinase|nr:sugar kinase [Bacteroidota bacterium]